MLELAILGLLKEQPLHGYELKKRLGETLGSLWGISYGSLYPALRRLERDGSIEIVEPDTASVPMPATGSLDGDLAAARLRRPAKSTRRTRKAYRITEQGDARFSQLLLDDDTAGDDERTFALKLAFCRHLDADARLELLTRRPRRARRAPGARPPLDARSRRPLHALALRAPHRFHPTRSRMGRRADRSRRPRPRRAHQSVPREPLGQQPFEQGATAS